MILNLKKINVFISVQHFHLETLNVILPNLRPQDWAVSIDLKDAYLHVPQGGPQPEILAYRSICCSIVVWSETRKHTQYSSVPTAHIIHHMYNTYLYNVVCNVQRQRSSKFTVHRRHFTQISQKRYNLPKHP